MPNVEVVVVFASETEKSGPISDFSFSPSATDGIISVLQDFDVSLEPVFPSIDTGLALPTAENASSEALEMARYYRTEIAEDQAEGLASRLSELPDVETAYVKPAVENPIAPQQIFVADAGQTADFIAQQSYLTAAPDGVGATFAWNMSGGRGDAVHIIDIEGGWCLDHEDLVPNGGLLAGTMQQAEALAWRNHGTAVMGEIAGKDNGFGITGIAPNSLVSVVSHGGLGSAGAIRAAASNLSPGDIMLLEMHRPGPRHGFRARQDQLGYIAVEWWPDDFLAIRFALLSGIIVVEAAGNGAEDLDDSIYDIPHPNFPTNWQNPFNDSHDSGAIFVGAGAPPSGAYGVDRSRLDFSNYGSRLDCQGDGRGVVTTGYGNLFGYPDEKHFYTNTFSGTSSASPIVVGALACVQGIARAQNRQLTPDQARKLLRNSGSAQQASALAPTSQRIGSRPDIEEILNNF